jgi:hypothetical protein
MKYVDRALKFDRVQRSIGVSAMVLDNFEDPWSFPSPRFRAWVLATKLRNAESGSNFIDSGKANRSSLLDPVQNSGFSPGTLSVSCEYPSFRISRQAANPSNIIVEHFHNSPSRGTGNTKCQPQIAAKSIFLNRSRRTERNENSH